MAAPCPLPVSVVGFCACAWAVFVLTAHSLMLKLGLQELNTTDILFTSAGSTGQQKPGARRLSDLNGLSLISRISVGKKGEVLFPLIVLLSVK